MDKSLSKITTPAVQINGHTQLHSYDNPGVVHRLTTVLLRP